jgi:hypothetical protein
MNTQTQVSDAEFEQFVMNNRFAQEDENNAKADLERQRTWFDDATAEAEELKFQRDELPKNAAGEPNDQAEWDRLDGLFQAADQARQELKAAVEGFEAAQLAKIAEREENERLRVEAAETERKMREAEVRDREAQDRERDAEWAKQERKDIKKEKKDNEKMIEQLMGEQEEVKDNQTWLAIEDHIRSLQNRNDEIDGRVKQITANLKQLADANEEYAKW